ncbi:pentapeptide repeat-containing protein [Streptosporangium roseum]|uniref:pentapeptide repeat-containing protein n=1 Tax=Streptosporangium roseum TaxID=2001 RepID=UPI00068E49ED|nr:pentapeptide repeat-containing protein [Streptosporangium roseum]
MIAACTWAAIMWTGPTWERWVLAGVALTLAACLALAALIGPAARYLAGERAPLTDVERTEMTAAERVEAVNSARHTLVQAVTGLVVIGGVVFTALGLWYTAQTLNTTQQGQITDRYTKAIEQLGSTKSDVRLGGIYALQRLTTDSTRDRDTIRNVLSAFVRNHDGCALQPGEKTPPKRCSDAGEDNGPYVRLPADVVAALTIAPTLSAFDESGEVNDRADFSFSRFPKAFLISAFLRGADLTEADLRGANLTGADLRGANLAGTDLTRANLAGTDLTGTDLNGADLTGADLTGANLTRADLRGAFLNGADLTGAFLNGAKLNGAFLNGADLTRAVLRGAVLRGADLGADLTGADLGADLRGADLTSADLTRADLRGANLHGAVLRDAVLRGANLTGADLGADLTRADLTGAVLRGADLRGVRGITEQQVQGMAIDVSDMKFGPLE